MVLTDTERAALGFAVNIVDKAQAVAKAFSGGAITAEMEAIIPWISHLVGPIAMMTPVLGEIAMALPMLEKMADLLNEMALHGMSPDDPRNIERTNANQD